MILPPLRGVNRLYIFQKGEFAPMNTPFPRLLVLLRKEKGISQKQAAADLGVSQALLSHYEKGIRQGSLEFVVRVADYYKVSCDYLLGRTADKSGAVVNVEEIPSGDESKVDNKMRGTVIPVLNKKLIFNSINILFELLQKYNSKSLTNDVSEYLMLAIYMMFREMYEANPKNPEAFFSEPKYRYASSVQAKMSLLAADVQHLASGNSIDDQEGTDVKKLPVILPDELTKEYPMFAASLMNLLKKADNELTK